MLWPDFQASFRWPPTQSIIIAAFPYFEYFAHLLNWKFKFVVFYEPIFFLSP
jgi:hypothetical protein